MLIEYFIVELGRISKYFINPFIGPILIMKCVIFLYCATFSLAGIFGGYLLGCRSSATGLAFYDWETQELVRRIEIQPRQVFWSENGDYVCIATDENYFILKFVYLICCFFAL